MNQRHEEIVIETTRHRITGSLTIPSEGYRSRLSDYVNQREREFLALENVKVSFLEAPEESRSLPFLLVSRRHIVLVTPSSDNS